MNLILLSKSEYLHKSALTVQQLVVLGTVFSFFFGRDEKSIHSDLD